MRPIIAFCLSLFLLVPAFAEQGQEHPEAEAIGAVIARWYEELARKVDGRYWLLTTPRFIDASPHSYPLVTRSAAAGPRVYDSLAATALLFEYDIETMRIDTVFAKVSVWERGYFYAPALERTTERAKSTLFVLEREEQDGRWLILAHESISYGIPPDKITDPMPDLRDAYFSSLNGRDPIFLD